MSYQDPYALDGEDLMRVIIRAIGADTDLVENLGDAYWGLGASEDQAVARFIDRLLCEAQEAIGDPWITWDPEGRWPHLVAEERGIASGRRPTVRSPRATSSITWTTTSSTTICRTSYS